MRRRRFLGLVRALFSILGAGGTSYSTSRTVLSSNGTAYLVGGSVLSSTGTSYLVI